MPRKATDLQEKSLKKLLKTKTWCLSPSKLQGCCHVAVQPYELEAVDRKGALPQPASWEKVKKGLFLGFLRFS